MAKAKAILRISFRSERQMRAIADALKPEIARPAGSSARATLARRGRKLVLRFEGRDSGTLRAIMSSYLRLVRASLNSSNALLKLEDVTSRSVRGKN